MRTRYELKAWLRNQLFRWHIPPRRAPDGYVEYLRRYAIDVVIDAGANNGQYARHVRSHGYTGRIVSFEPLPDAFAKLRANAQGFPEWQVVPAALGAYDGDCTLHVAGNSQSSSLLPMGELHLSAAPESAYIRDLTVPIHRLDSILGRYCAPTDRCYLKLDVQGSEQDILRGAEKTLERCLGIQLEMAVQPLYVGESVFEEMLTYLSDRGYCLMTLHPVFGDRRTGQVLQFDGVFFRRDAVESLRRAA